MAEETITRLGIAAISFVVIVLQLALSACDLSDQRLRGVSDE
jgi:hypothetical protein